MPRMLIVDDEEKIRVLIKRYAEFEGHTVAEAGDGMEAIEKCRNEDFDIVIMDIMMPVLDGFSAAKEIRKTKNIPIIMLSAKGEEYDKIYGFEVGVDDYVVKPFSSKELMMRVSAVLRRSGKVGAAADSHEVFVKDDLHVDMTAYKVFIDKVEIPMAPKVYELLFYFIQNKNIAIAREKLITEVWGYDYFGDDRTLDTHIKLLRQALGEYGNLIATIRGHGYRFEG